MNGSAATMLRIRVRARSAVVSPAAGRAAAVAACLVGLELLMFWSYFSGAVSPAPDDFIGSYNNEPLAWWRDLASGGLPQWVPYAWGGYPAAVSIQSGAWYVPLGLAAAVSPYSIHAAAVLQALHVAFGALGVYVTSRRWGAHHFAALFGLVAYFFAVGFYTNALHPDIVRGFAWAPWVFLALSPDFPWRRRWGVPLAGVIFWQALAGTYPGVIVALAYSGAALVVVFQLTRRPALRAYLAPLAIAGVAAALLSAVKYLPALVLRGIGSPTGRDDSVFSGQMWGTLFYPYDLPGMPNDLSMRSFFVVAPVWALAALAWKYRGRLAPLVAAGLTAAILGLPFFPWYDLTGSLPGMGMSRFRMADFRAPLVVSLVLLAVMVLSNATQGARRHETTRVRALVVLVLVLVPSFALLVAVLGEFDIARWTTPWAVLAGSAAVVAWLTVTSPPDEGRRPERVVTGTIALTVLAAVSGVNWAYSVTPPWRFDREQIEVSTWGEDSDGLIARHEETDELVQRPARTPLDDVAAPPTDVHWNSSFYTGLDAVGGYVNLKGSSSFDLALEAVTSDQTYFESRVLLAAPGIGIAVDGDDSLPAVEAVEPCAVDGVCGTDVTVTPDGYEVGHLRYRVDAASDQTMLFNEAFYPGWTMTACDATGEACQELTLAQGAAGLVLAEVPAGHWHLRLDYRTPGAARDTALFAAGFVLALVGGWTMARRRRPPSETTRDRGRQRTPDARAPSSDVGGSQVAGTAPTA